MTGVVRVERAANPWISSAVYLRRGVFASCICVVVYLRCDVTRTDSSGLGSRAVRQSRREVCGLVQAGSDRQHLEAATRRVQ